MHTTDELSAVREVCVCVCVCFRHNFYTHTSMHAVTSLCVQVRAMQIIDQLEVTKRGPYGGGVGHVSFSGGWVWVWVWV